VSHTLYLFEMYIFKKTYISQTCLKVKCEAFCVSKEICAFYMRKVQQYEKKNSVAVIKAEYTPESSRDGMQLFCRNGKYAAPLVR
jgi:hypothetical protein